MGACPESFFQCSGTSFSKAASGPAWGSRNAMNEVQTRRTRRARKGLLSTWTACTGHPGAGIHHRSRFLMISVFRRGPYQIHTWVYLLMISTVRGPVPPSGLITLDNERLALASTPQRF